MRRLAQTLGRTNMNLGPIIPTEANIARFRGELASATEAELIAQAAKDPNMAPGVAAKQLLAALRAKREAEARKAHWTQTPGFIATVGFGIVGIIAWLYPRQPASDTKDAPTPVPQTSSQPAVAASLPPSLLATPNSQAASAPPSVASQSK